MPLHFDLTFLSFAGQACGIMQLLCTSYSCCCKRSLWLRERAPTLAPQEQRFTLLYKLAAPGSQLFQAHPKVPPLQAWRCRRPRSRAKCKHSLRSREARFGASGGELALWTRCLIQSWLRQATGAFQRIPMVPPAEEHLASALRRARRVGGNVKLRSEAARARNRAARQMVPSRHLCLMPCVSMPSSQGKGKTFLFLDLQVC